MLENAKHRLRAVEPEDANLLHRWENDDKTWWLGGSVTPYSKATLMKFATGDHDLYRDKQLRLMLDYKNNDGAWITVGAVDLYDFDPRNSRAGVGVVVDLNHRKKGHGGLGLELLREYAFQHLALNQLFAEVPESHKSSISLFNNAGYISCETRKNWVRGVNSWEDVILMQLLNRV